MRPIRFESFAAMAGHLARGELGGGKGAFLWLNKTDYVVPNGSTFASARMANQPP